MGRQAKLGAVQQLEFCIMQNLGFMGFGEAGAAFAKGFQPSAAQLIGYDTKLNDQHSHEAMHSRMLYAGVQPCSLSNLGRADAVFCLVTADQALEAAQSAAPYLAKGAVWLDGNSCAPSTKHAASAVIAAVGAAYVDMAIMAPVHPKGHKTPVLVSGPYADAALALMGSLGMNGAAAGAEVGDASSIKMLRSIIIKGMEALTAEAFLAAKRAGVEDAVIASLQVSDNQIDWQARGAYNLERMITHGARRAAEMTEVARFLDELNLPNHMAVATAQWQTKIAGLGLHAGTDHLATRADMVLQAMT